MREKFNSFHEIYGCYLFIKTSMRGTKTLLPSKVLIHFEYRKHIIDRIEEKMCFIADVERFMESLTFAERNIFQLYFERPEASFEWIARWFRKNWKSQGFRVERKFFHRQNVCNTFHRVKERGNAYFTGNGYIQKGEKTQ